MGIRRHDGNSRVTLNDVAEAAGVSSITVSRALRNPDIVSESLREKIIAIVEDMGYVPDFAARALASQNSGVIAVLVPSMSNYVFPAAMAGIEARVSSTDLRIHYANSHFSEEEEVRQLKLFLGQRPAGVIIAGVGDGIRGHSLLQRVHCPVVQALDRTQPPLDMAVGIDNFAAAASAARHVVEEGYRNIAILGAAFDIAGQRRRQGFQSVLEQHGLFDRALISCDVTSYDIQVGAQLLGRLLDSGRPIDAVLCQSDELALGALFECQRRGIRVPEEFGICGFYDLEFAGTCPPGLTTVRLPLHEIGRLAADMVIRAQTGDRQVSTMVDVGFELVVRGSTKRRPA